MEIYLIFKGAKVMKAIKIISLTLAVVCAVAAVVAAVTVYSKSYKKNYITVCE